MIEILPETILDDFTTDGFPSSCDYVTWKMRACCGRTKAGKPCGMLGSLIHEDRVYCWQHHARIVKEA